MAQFQFKASEAPASTMPTRGPLPAGQYEVIISNSDIKATKAGDGEYIELEMQVTDGEHSGRRLWERLNISNPNKKAEDIAKAALGELCVACGIDDMTDTEQLHDIPLLAVVEIDRKDPTRNRVMGYRSAGKAMPPKPAAAPTAPARPSAPQSGSRPWAR